MATKPSLQKGNKTNDHKSHRNCLQKGYKKEKEMSNLYICTNGHIFDEPIEWTEHHYGDYIGHLTERMWGCPICREGFVEAQECEKCGKVFPLSDLTEGLCDDCYAEEEYEEPADLEVGFNPYMGCYDYDC